MRRIASICLLSLASALFCADITASNEFGEYTIKTPQSAAPFNGAKSACEALAQGYRLPNIKELFNAPEEIIQNGEKSLYASLSENQSNKDEIYYFSFENRDVNVVAKKENLFFVCVKPKEYKEAQNLKWQASERNRMSHPEAKSFCESKGARLPSAKELFSIALLKLNDEKTYLERFGFTQPKYYWSADVNDDFSNTAIVVGFLRASVANSAKDNKSFVRCVADAK